LLTVREIGPEITDQRTSRRPNSTPDFHTRMMSRVVGESA